MQGGHDHGSEAMEASAVLVLACASPEEARVLWRAVSTDDPGSVEGTVEGSLLRIRAGPAGAPSLRTTLDDLLACIQAAWGTLPGKEEDEGVG